MAESDALDPTHELGYQAQRSTLYLAGKHAAVAVGENINSMMSESGAAVGKEVADNASGFFAAFKGLGGIITIAITAAISAGLAELDYIHKRRELKTMYGEELSAKLRKPRSAVNDRDLENFSQKNNTIGEHIAKIRKQRNFGVVMSFVASMSALAVVFAVEAIIPGFHEYGTLAQFAVKSIVGLSTYHAIKRPLHWLADKMFNIDEETAHDRIKLLKGDIETGKTVTREQVMGVFVVAHPELEKIIVQNYGKGYDHLALDDKRRVTAEFSQHIPLDSLTTNINTNKINATELAFAVQGDISGVEHMERKAPKEKTLIGKAMSRAADLFMGRKHHTVITEPIHSPTMRVPNEVVALKEDQPTTHSFVKSLGREKVENNLSFVERIDKTRAEPASGITVIS
jgi:hypothetical protein